MDLVGAFFVQPQHLLGLERGGDVEQAQPLRLGAAQTLDAVRVADRGTEHLEAAQLPVAELDVVARGEDRVEIVAKLVRTNIAGSELDALTDHLATVHGISHATWQARTHD